MAGAIMVAVVALLAGCRSESESSAPSAMNATVTPDLDAQIARASTLRQTVLVLVTESGLSRADDRARANFETFTAKNDSFVSVLLDLSFSRNRATAARFHVTNTPALFCLSSQGLIVSRDDAPITHALLTKRAGEVAQLGPELDVKLGFIAEAASLNPHDAPAQFELANFFLAQQNDHEAIPLLEKVAHNEATDPALRIRAWTALARAHLWVGEPEKARHEAEDLIVVLGPKQADAQAGGDFVLGLQDAANVKRIPQARREFEEAIAASPNSDYGRQAAEALAKLPGETK